MCSGARRAEQKAKPQMSGVLEQVIRLVRRPASEEVTDGQLLERLVAGQQESAFAALVWRHGPMVLGVCRRMLGNRHDAEEAFQATFLVLFRRARFLKRSGSLASWLYTVAYHAAIRAKACYVRRRLRERQGGQMRQSPTHGREAWTETPPIPYGEP